MESSARQKPKEQKMSVSSPTSPSLSNSVSDIVPEDVLGMDSDLLESAKESFATLLPFVDKLPRNIVCDEESLNKQTTSSAFLRFIQSSHPDESLEHMPTSRLVNCLHSYAHHGSQSSNNSTHVQRPIRNRRTTVDRSGSKSEHALSTLHRNASTGISQARQLLQEKLEAKLEQFKAKRKALLSEKEAGEARIIRNKLRRLKLKERTRKKKSANPNESQQETNGLRSPPPGSQMSSPRSASVVSEEGRMIYSKFDFFQDPSVESNALTHPKQRKGKNLTHLLNQAVAEKRRVQEAESEMGPEAKQKKAWQEALLKAQGIKLKNDPVKLKQAMKEKEKQKKKSAKKWAERLGTVHKEMRQKQKKRETNLQAKKDKASKKKRQKMIKKGRIIPGFN